MLSSQKEKEWQAFKDFLEASPTLALQIENWHVQEADGSYPDIICVKQDGQEFGFELGEWIIEEQISQSIKIENFKCNVIRAIGEQPKNSMTHIKLVLLTHKNNQLRFISNDSEKLRKELFSLIKKTDLQWTNEPQWQSPGGYHCSNFAGYATLEKYLQEVWFLSENAGISRKPWIPWIEFKGNAGSYSGEPARKALQDIIIKKIHHYGTSSEQQIHLLVHYGPSAFNHNTPFIDITTPDFQSIAKITSKVVQSCRQVQDIPFDRIYLCNTLSSELDAYEIFPQLAKCE
ncbi:hypothetical protein [Candidatus Nitrospira salsa]